MSKRSGKSLLLKNKCVLLFLCAFCLHVFVVNQGVVLASEASCVAAPAKKSFLIAKNDNKKQKSMSKGTLKENIGQETRDAFHVSTQIAKQAGMILVNLPTSNADGVITLCKPVGSFQVQLSSIQNNFSQIIENLVDDAKLFKKAHRGDLCSAYECMKKVNQNLNKQLHDLSAIQKNVLAVSGAKESVSVRVKKITDNLQRCLADLKTVNNDMNSQACLKNV